MSLKSDELSMDLVRLLEDEADTLSIELDGEVNIIQSKDGIVLLRDKLPADVVIKILKQFVEDAVRDLIKAEGTDSK